MFDDRIMPIEIRPGYSVMVQDIPHDLTESEAQKLCLVLKALVCRKKDVADV